MANLQLEQVEQATAPIISLSRPEAYTDVKPGIAQFTQHGETTEMNEAKAQPYDLRKSVVSFDGCSCYHMNAEWTGDRYVVVLFNTDFSQHDRTIGLCNPDARTEDIRCLPTPDVPEVVHIDRTHPKYVKLRRAIAKEIQFCNFFRRPQAKYSGKSEIILFGELTVPYKQKGRHQTLATASHQTLYNLLLEYMEHLMREGGQFTAADKPLREQFSTMLLAKNSKCNWHLDKQNVGWSLITAFGNYDEAAGTKRYGGGSMHEDNEDIDRVEYAGGELLINPTKEPLWECFDCHVHNRCKRECRINRHHVGEDWINTVWKRMKSGDLVSKPGVSTRHSIRISDQVPIRSKILTDTDKLPFTRRKSQQYAGIDRSKKRATRCSRHAAYKQASHADAAQQDYLLG